MELKIQIRYSSDEHGCLCFACAARKAVNGAFIRTEADDFTSEYDMRNTECEVCGVSIVQY